MVPFWMARVARTAALPIVEVLKLETKSSEAVRWQSWRTMGVFCRTKRPVDATVSSLISRELVIAVATGQCDERNELVKASGKDGVM